MGAKIKNAPQRNATQPSRSGQTRARIMVVSSTTEQRHQERRIASMAIAAAAAGAAVSSKEEDVFVCTVQRHIRYLCARALPDVRWRASPPSDDCIYQHIFGISRGSPGAPRACRRDSTFGTPLARSLDGSNPKDCRPEEHSTHSRIHLTKSPHHGIL